MRNIVVAYYYSCDWCGRGETSDYGTQEGARIAAKERGFVFWTKEDADKIGVGFSLNDYNQFCFCETCWPKYEYGLKHCLTKEQIEEVKKKEREQKNDISG